MWWNTITRSPAANLRTLAPTAATTPEVSCPKMRGAEWEPGAIFFKSVPQTPHVCTPTRNSPAPVLGTERGCGCRDLRMYTVGDYFCCGEWGSVNAGRGSHCSRFHIHGQCSVGLCQLYFLILVGHYWECYQHAFSAFEIDTAAVSRVD